MTSLSDKMCNEIEELELNAPRVNKETIDALMDNVVFETHIVPGTNTTQASAIYNGFVLAVGETSCVSAANFNAELGAKYAIEKAKVVAFDKLWELEGWRLKMHLESIAEGV